MESLTELITIYFEFFKFVALVIKELAYPLTVIAVIILALIFRLIAVNIASRKDKPAKTITNSVPLSGDDESNKGLSIFGYPPSVLCTAALIVLIAFVISLSIVVPGLYNVNKDVWVDALKSQQGLGKKQNDLKKFIPIAQEELAAAQIDVQKKEAAARGACKVKGEACKKALVEKLEAERKLAEAKTIYQDLLNGDTSSFRFRQNSRD